MRSLRSIAVVLSVAFLAACGGVVASAGPSEVSAQSTGSTALAQCREAARYASGVVFQDLAEAYAHRISDESFAAYFNEWLGRLGGPAQDMLTECQAIEPNPAP